MAEPRKIHLVLEEAQEKKSRWPGANIILPFVSAVAGTVAVLSIDLFNLKQTQSQFETSQGHLEAELEIVREQGNRELTIAEDRLLSQIVTSLQSTSDYDAQRRAISLVAEISGIQRALEIEAFNRSGATIRALQQIAQSVVEEGRPEHDPELAALNSVLDTAPKAIFIDSSHENNAYCDASAGNQRTNIDDIFPIVRHLPFQFFAERVSFNSFGSKEAEQLVERIVMHEPELIVLHHGAFDGTDFLDSIGGEDLTISLFLAAVFEEYSPSVIIYSRTSNFSESAPDWYAELGSSSPYFEKLNAEVLAREEDRTNNRDCFSRQQPNGQRILASVERAIATMEAYQLGLR
ncbi:hypothetical protein L0664_16045 [Octadecabacter sp. G9-8]|uniref:Uncharacterized protein n=1 Tax=Octadecabacter dasysiphoniae TaxID=2909341 RepID=A0ABS9CZB7_9RHOB|nr:hypothetical protein [Octadecabacter dasysiphoniae]MCF2872588.1 hypothetical protein [Octadecabacter dasysiphoniae]